MLSKMLPKIYGDKIEHHLVPGENFEYHGEFIDRVNPRNVELR